MRAQPRAQERPKAFHGIDRDLTEAVVIFVRGILGLGMSDGFMGVTPGLQLTVNGIFVGKDERSGLDGLPYHGRHGLLLDIGQPLKDDFPAALNHTEDGRLFFVQRASPWCSSQPSAASGSALLKRCFGMAFVSSHDVHLSAFHFPAQLDRLFFATMPSRSWLVMSCTTSLSTSNSAAICWLHKFNPI